MDRLPFEKIQREILIKKEVAADFGVAPEKRTTQQIINYGVVNIDKPKGPTSHQTSDFVKRILQIKKAGHSGTLDPKVTGVLPVALGRATRLAQALLPAGKEYVALMYVHKPLEEEFLRKSLIDFTGKITQKPPVKSAVRRINRIREVYYVEILEVKGQEVLFKIGCQAGTYIRKYIHDFGKKVGCGAHMEELRRTKVAAFNEETLCTLQDLADAFYYYKQENKEKFLRKIIQPVETAVAHLPKVWVLDAAIGSLSHGRDLAVPGISRLETNMEKDNLAAIMTLKGEIIALGTAIMDSEEIMQKRNGIAVRTEKVFIL
jgi:H/ACA ribonucleoprotein complex subunit 4